MSLSQLNTGQVGYIESIDSNIDPVMRRRLLDLGFVPNSKISVLKQNFWTSKL